ncbi:L-lactate permease [Macrococcoides caseolyticum]|uniref:L-lactate permease n=1 Tax=Macrococcoides caseolyticum TaxID=69966 RepID=UPI001F194863|nr:L-lactate permease [Macrococcus caseolyticus]MCE4956470.1 L-lactate permease [Macrococcus caseolyticus]
MFVSSFDPFGNLALSAIVAAVPIILFLLCLTIFKMKGINAALLTLVVTALIALFVFKLPGAVAVGGVTEGVVQGLFPIGYIIIMAVWLYKVTVESGKFKVIQDSISGISQDQRIQLLLIAFCFNAFLEGAAGFGVPIAICAVLLVQLGFEPLKAAMFCLVANAASGAFGAIGIPVGIVNTLGLKGDITAMDVSQMTAYTLPIINIAIPFLLIFILDGLKGIKETLPAILVTGAVYTIVQMIITLFMGPELAALLPALIAMGALALFCQKWQPKNIFRLTDEKVTLTKHPLKEIVLAWSPFYLLTGFVLVWSMPVFKALFLPGGMLEKAVLQYQMPGTFNETLQKGVMLKLDLIGATGTAILLSVLLTIILSPKINFETGFELLGKTIKELWIPVLTICAILAIAKLTTYGGLTVAMGQAIAKTGSIFPLLAPILGWIGVFMTGSVVNNNVLFASIQATVGHSIGTNPALLVAANTAGGVMAKLISPQSIAIATAAVGAVGQESKLLSMTLKYSIGLLLFVCIWTYVLSMVL